MLVNFLEAKVPLVKHFTATSKAPYPNAFEFKSWEYDVVNLQRFAELIQAHSLRGHCLLKGELTKPLNWESRAGSTDPAKPSGWACFDLDDFSSFPEITSAEQGQMVIDDFMAKVGLAHVSYILQWSASFGINGKFPLRAHIIFFYKTPVNPVAQKAWLRQLNLTSFQSDLSLTKTQASLRWPLDITTCQSDKLLFTAPPVCNPPEINHFRGERVVYVAGKRDCFDFSTVTLLPVEQLKTLEIAEVNRLRKAANLTERKARLFNLKESNGELYLPDPDQATVTGVKEERDFVYLNLNNGDSWGYYHPKDNPTFIYNFKGEPTYKTAELLPDYWVSLKRAKKAAVQAMNAGKLFLAFRDFKSARYYNGWYDQATDELTLHEARSERQLDDFMIAHGQPVQDAIPIWTIEYDPGKGPIDVTNRSVNLFRPSEYMRAARQLPKGYVAKPTPAIERIIKHVMGVELYEPFLNWLAFCWQFKAAPCTAWIWHGVPGTGKGILANHILSKLFGESNVSMKRMEELEDRFNDHLENTLICFVDEAQISDSGRSKMIMANLKNQITEPRITIRRMRQSSYEITNHVGWIFASNMPDPVIVDQGDRRFYVGEYQTQPLVISDKDVVDICAELQEFANLLQSYAVDTQLARTPLFTETKEQMILVSRSSADTVADALNKGQLSVLWDSLPTVEDRLLDPATQIRLPHYRALLHDLILGKRDRLARDELYVIFNYNVGGVPASPWKFTKYLKHHNVIVRDIRINDRHTKGIEVEWTDSEAWFDARREELKALLNTENVVPLKKTA